MSKHTPGPWENSDGLIGQCTWNQPACDQDEPYLHIATVNDIEGLNHGRRRTLPAGTAKANARLIASAPELLAELRFAVRYYNAGGHFDLADTVSKVIAKAEGTDE